MQRETQDKLFHTHTYTQSNIRNARQFGNKSNLKSKSAGAPISDSAALQPRFSEEGPHPHRFCLTPANLLKLKDLHQIVEVFHRTSHIEPYERH